MGASASRREDPKLAVAAGRRQTLLMVLCYAMFLLAGAVLGMTFWQVSDQGVQGGNGAPVCTFRPAVVTVGTVTTTCMWDVPNSAVRALAGFLTIAVFLLMALKIGWFRTERKIVYVILVVLSWLGTTCWLVMAGWDANEIRVAAGRCSQETNAACDFGKYIGTVVIEIALWVFGWVFSIVFSVWLRREDFRRSVGMCGQGPPRRRGDRQRIEPMPSAPPGDAEMEDF